VGPVDDVGELVVASTFLLARTMRNLSRDCSQFSTEARSHAVRIPHGAG